MAGIGIILNRNAGKQQPFRGRIGEKLAYVLGEPDSLRETSSIEDIDDVARAFLERNIDVLGISGGDGSNHYTLSTFVKLYGDYPLPMIAFLRGGTHNAHAQSIGIEGSPESILERIVRRYHSGGKLPSVRRKLLKIDDGNGVRYGFSMATGFMYRFYQELHIRQDDTTAKVVMLILSWLGSYMIRGKKIREMFRLEPGTITLSGTPLPWKENNGISCSTMERLGLGFTPYPRANETIDKFQMAALRIKIADFIRLLWDFKRGRVPSHPDQINTITESVLLEAEQPVSYVLDGELYHGTKRLEVVTGPQIRLVLV
jgi:diacylglycerol kinase (ATP)